MFDAQNIKKVCGYNAKWLLCKPVLIAGDLVCFMQHVDVEKLCKGKYQDNLVRILRHHPSS